MNSTELYESYKGLIISICQKFQKRCGGELDELIAEGNFHFMQIIQQYDPSRGSFKTFLAFKLQKCLHETRRVELLHKKLCPTEGMKETPSKERSEFNLRDFLWSVGDDAVLLCRMALDSPIEIIHLVEEMEKNNPYIHHDPMNIRKAIRKLLHSIGWSMSRIQETFSEIRSALT